MAPRPPKRHRDGDDGEADDEGCVDLGSPEHAWWAQRPTEQLWTPRAEPTAAVEPPRRDILAEHFGPDWRTSFGFDPPAEDAPTSGTAAPGPEPVPLPERDPYEVLGVTETATWEEIVAAHRALARAHHPDLVAQRPEAERIAAEDRIRQVNIAYQALRIRRAR